MTLLKGNQKTKSIQQNREHGPFEDLLVRHVSTFVAASLGETPQHDPQSHQKPLPPSKLEFNFSVLWEGEGRERMPRFLFENKLSLCDFSCLQTENNLSCFFLFSFVFVPGQPSTNHPFQDHPPQDHPKFALFPSSAPKFHSFFTVVSRGLGLRQ